MKRCSQWKRTFAAGLLGSALFASVAMAATAAEIRMQSNRVTSSRVTQSQRGRVVAFKSDRTDSWLCENVSPFFCNVVPTAAAAPAETPRQRGRQ